MKISVIRTLAISCVPRSDATDEVESEFRLKFEAKDCKFWEVTFKLSLKQQPKIPDQLFAEQQLITLAASTSTKRIRAEHTSIETPPIFFLRRLNVATAGSG